MAADVRGRLPGNCCRRRSWYVASRSLPQLCDLLFQVGELPLHDAITNNHLSEKWVHISGPCGRLPVRGCVLKDELVSEEKMMGEGYMTGEGDMMGEGVTMGGGVRTGEGATIGGCVAIDEGGTYSRPPIGIRLVRDSGRPNPRPPGAHSKLSVTMGSNW